MVALALGGLALVGCASNADTTTSGPSVAAVAAELSQSQPKGGGGSAAPGTSVDQPRRNSGGSVTIDVTWENPRANGAPLAFAVVMDTHSVDLDRYDLGKLAVLRNDRGQELKPERWDAPEGGHHRSGALVFPAKDGAGKAISGPGVKTLELVILDVAGVKERVLRWELSG